MKDSRAAQSVLVVACVFVAAASCSHREMRGGVGFFYGRALSPEQLELFSRFEVLVTHDPLPVEQVTALHARGTRLALYHWSVAFYESLVKPGSWEEMQLRGRTAALLNATPLRGHLGSATADAWYVDPFEDSVCRARAAALATAVRNAGYDGVFLDTTTAASVHPDALREYERRHPGVAYDVSYRKFIRALRDEFKDGPIVTNQGYRSAENYLPYADWDVTESLITRPQDGRFALRPWSDPADRWNAISTIFEQLIEPARTRYPQVRFAHLNYLSEPSSEEARTIALIAKLFGDSAFVTSPDLERPVPTAAYFEAPGRATSPSSVDGGRVSRRFQHGTIVVMLSPPDSIAAASRRVVVGADTQ